MAAPLYECEYPHCKCQRYGRCGKAAAQNTRTIWYAVADLKHPPAEPFAVISVDTAARREGGVEGTVVSLHWVREEAESVVYEFNGGPLS